MRKVIANSDFDRRVTVQQRATTTDGYGGRVDAWADSGTVWAKYQPQAMTGIALNEMADQPQLLEKATFTFRTPKSFNVDTTSCLVYRNSRWKIIGMAEAGLRNEYTVVNAVKSDSDIYGDATVETTIGNTNQTLDQLITFFNEYGNAETPEIQYMQIPVMSSDPDLWQEEFDAAGVPTFKTHLDAGDYETKEVSNIQHIARLDTTVPLNRQGQVLKQNNEFGNTWRFTFDDGTRYHPYMCIARSRTEIIARAADVGYTGDNPAYCIDNLTGLAVLFQTTRQNYNGGGGYTDATEGFEYYDPFRWWQVEADQSAYANSHESDIDYWAYLQGKTIQGHSDWRVANLNEFNILMLASQDQYLYASGGNEELQAELGIANELTPSAASMEFWDRAVEGIPHAPWHSVRDTNLHLIVQGPTNFNNFAYDDEGSSNTTRYYPVRSVTGVNTRNFANFTGAYYWAPVLVRRHFGIPA